MATSKPKSSDIVADIGGAILSTLYAARHLACRGAFSPAGTQKTPGPADQASRRSMHVSAAIVPRRSLTGQEKRMLISPCSYGRITRTYRGSHDLYSRPHSSGFMCSILHIPTAYACPSLAQHQYLAGSIPHNVFDGWIDLLHTSSYTHGRICQKNQVHELLLRFMYDRCTDFTRFQDTFADLHRVPGSTLGSY